MFKSDMTFTLNDTIKLSAVLHPELWGNHMSHTLVIPLDYNVGPKKESKVTIEIGRKKTKKTIQLKCHSMCSKSEIVM